MGKFEPNAGQGMGLVSRIVQTKPIVEITKILLYIVLAVPLL